MFHTADTHLLPFHVRPQHIEKCASHISIAMVIENKEIVYDIILLELCTYVCAHTHTHTHTHTHIHTHMHTQTHLAIYDTQRAYTKCTYTQMHDTIKCTHVHEHTIHMHTHTHMYRHTIHTHTHTHIHTYTQTITSIYRH